jgi:stress response protein YsnF
VSDTEQVSGTVRKERVKVEKQGDVEVRDDSARKRRK